MRIDIAQKAASLIERIEDLEKTILQLEQMREGTSYKVSTVSIDPKHGAQEVKVELKEGKLSTEIFQQNILGYTIDNFNVELEELKQELEDLS
jgi:competence CoiA-like predicted nuclease